MVALKSNKLDHILSTKLVYLIHIFIYFSDRSPKAGEWLELQGTGKKTVLHTYKVQV